MPHATARACFTQVTNGSSHPLDARAGQGGYAPLVSDALPLAILTSGGDAPGMNAAIRAIAKVAASHGVPVVGVEDGYTGLLEGRLRPLTIAEGEDGSLGVDPEMDFFGSTGGTVLGSARELRFLSAEGRAPAVQTMASLRGLIVVGGNGSLAGAHALAQESETPVIGIPASIGSSAPATGSATPPARTIGPSSSR